MKNTYLSWSELEKAYKDNIGLGRRTLYKNAIDEGLAISEYGD